MGQDGDSRSATGGAASSAASTAARSASRSSTTCSSTACAPPPTAPRPSADLSAQETLALTNLNVIGKMLDRSEKSHSRGRVFSWATTLRDFARMLDSVKGRKHIVYFSEGFDVETMFQVDDPIEGGSDDRWRVVVEVDRFQPLFGQRIEVARAANAGKYPPAARLQRDSGMAAYP